jgi:ribosomal-protein-alanine N-acetyltransferase
MRTRHSAPNRRISGTRASPITVEPMALDDLPQVMAIDAASFPRPWPEPSWRHEIIANANARCYVARVAPAAANLGLWRHLRARLFGMSEGADSVVAGMVCMWVIIDEAHIATIAAHPKYRGRKVGEHLLRHCLRHAIDNKCITVMLEVRVSNTVAQNLYRKFGFAVTGERKKYYSDNLEDALIMTIENLQSPDYQLRLQSL